MVDLKGLYIKHAQRFDQARQGGRMEEPYLKRAAEVAEGTTSCLDLGCGSSEPIARFFIERGYRVTGVDFSNAMLEIARSRFPEMSWIESDMRGFDFDQHDPAARDTRFDIVIAWDSFFHLSPGDQRGMFAVFHKHLNVGGALVLTSGPNAGEAVGGNLFGDVLYHASLDTHEYEALFEAIGCEVVQHVVEDPDCGGHTVWVVKRLH